MQYSQYLLFSIGFYMVLSDAAFSQRNLVTYLHGGEKHLSWWQVIYIKFIPFHALSSQKTGRDFTSGPDNFIKT